LHERLSVSMTPGATSCTEGDEIDTCWTINWAWSREYFNMGIILDKSSSNCL